MIQIRPDSDFRNRFTEIERCVKEEQPVFLTKKRRVRRDMGEVP